MLPQRLAKPDAPRKQQDLCCSKDPLYEVGPLGVNGISRDAFPARPIAGPQD